MGKQYAEISENIKEFIEEQKIFFVGTAATEGRVNVSPKGMDSLRVIGPNKPPTRAVPRRWTRNSAARITTVIGMTYGANTGVATFSPSTALNTEIAGVIMPSPYSPPRHTTSHPER